MFCQSVFEFVYRKPFLWSEHHEEIERYLMAVWIGDTQNLIINIPPRYSKTEMVCLFVAWTFAHNPRCEYLHLSYSSDLAIRNSDKIRQIVKSEFYQDVFCIKIDKDNDKKSEWRTVDGGIFYATAAGGQITGFGAGSTDELDGNGEFVFSGCVLIDDPLKPKDAHTLFRERTNDNWDETIKSRRNGDKTPVICIMQRIHEGDFTAHLMSDSSEKFEVLKMKALREDGTALWPRKHSSEKLESMRDNNIYVFSSQYQQEPTPAGGSIFKADWWKYFDDMPLEFDEVIITADTAQKTKEHNDYSVFQAWGKVGGNIYLIDQLRGKWEAPDLERVATAFIRRIKITYPSLHTVHIEDKASGTGLIQSIKGKAGVIIAPIKRNTDKVTRSFDAAPHIQAGQVWIQETASFAGVFVAECSSFSAEDTHLHDDQVDAMMDAVDILLDKAEVSIFDVL
jgi:predicted phage terminase large subunit-like protein